MDKGKQARELARAKCTAQAKNSHQHQRNHPHITSHSPYLPVHRLHVPGVDELPVPEHVLALGRPRLDLPLLQQQGNLEVVKKRLAPGTELVEGF